MVLHPSSLAAIRAPSPPDRCLGATALLAGADRFLDLAAQDAVAASRALTNLLGITPLLRGGLRESRERRLGSPSGIQLGHHLEGSQTLQILWLEAATELASQ